MSSTQTCISRSTTSFSSYYPERFVPMSNYTDLISFGHFHFCSEEEGLDLFKVLINLISYDVVGVDWLDKV